MRSEIKLVKTASRSALAGEGAQARLPNDCKAPEAGWLASQNRLGHFKVVLCKDGYELLQILDRACQRDDPRRCHPPSFWP